MPIAVPVLVTLRSFSYAKGQKHASHKRATRGRFHLSRVTPARTINVRHTSPISHHASHLSCQPPQPSPHFSQLARHLSHVPPLPGGYTVSYVGVSEHALAVSCTPLITRHTSHVTRHTSHVIQVLDTVTLGNVEAEKGGSGSVLTSYFGTVDNITMGAVTKGRSAAAAAAATASDFSLDPDFYPLGMWGMAYAALNVEKVTSSNPKPQTPNPEPQTPNPKAGAYFIRRLHRPVLPTRPQRVRALLGTFHWHFDTRRRRVKSRRVKCGVHSHRH